MGPILTEFSKQAVELGLELFVCSLQNNAVGV